MTKFSKNHLQKHLAAFLLLLVPCAIYLLIYLLPLGNIMSLSVDNSEMSNRFTHFNAYVGSADQNEKAAALIQDIGAMSVREQGEMARMLNQEISGFRSLFLNTAKNVERIEKNYTALTAFDKRWAEDKYWDVLESNTSPYTMRHLAKAIGVSYDISGHLTVKPGEDIYLRIMLRTLIISLQVTILTLLIGYPLAYVVANGSARLGSFVMMVVLLSFWTSILVRTVAWVILLQTSGSINNLFISLGFIAEPIQLIFNRFGAIVAMTHVLLPFAIIPMINVMRTIPPAQKDASRSLGAGAAETFIRVYFPQSLRGVTLGGGTVFILALGFYVTPALTGGPNDQMLSFYIAEFIKKHLNWGMAAALSMLLLFSVILLLSIYAALRYAMTRKRSTL